MQGMQGVLASRLSFAPLRCSKCESHRSDRPVYAGAEAPVKDAEKVQGEREPAQKRSGLNKYSKTVTQPKNQGGSQAMLYATGLQEGDMDKAQVLHPRRPL